ncbi:MAG: hypothetical protein HUK14_04790 [Muribaculaceae bacterium]|nr:hypothetical protein [Muribaculaceae bacterium]
MESRRATVTEIEIFDTAQPPDPATGERPLKARIRQRQAAENAERAIAETSARENTETTTGTERTYDGEELSDVAVTSEKTPTLWERMKQGATWAVAIIILAAAGCIIYKIKKH